MIRFEVNAEVTLVCQASLETFGHRVERESLLAVIEELAEQDLLPGHYEAVQADHGKVAFRDLVEDELILGLPHIPRKPGLEPVAWSSGQEQESPVDVVVPRSPFAALGDLLHKDSDSAETDTD